MTACTVYHMCTHHFFLPLPSLPGDTLARRKLGLLTFSAAAGLAPAEMLLVYLAASCDPNEQVGPLFVSMPCVSLNAARWLKCHLL